MNENIIRQNRRLYDWRPLKGTRIKLSGTRCSSMSPSLYASTKQVRDSPTHSGCQPRVESPKTDSAKTNAKSGRQPSNYSWAQPMMRVFEFDVLLPPLWRKDENLVRNKFAGGDSEDSGLSGTSYESSAHSACHFGWRWILPIPIKWAANRPALGA